MELVMIRHGLPEWVEAKDGSPADPSLSDKGRVQAECMADWLTGDFDHIYASPMRRAAETAAPLALRHDVELEFRDGLAEYDKQSSVYIPVEKLKEVDYERWRKLMQGETRSDLSAFSETVTNTIEDIISLNRGKRIAVVCHGGVINVWTCHVIGFRTAFIFQS